MIHALFYDLDIYKQTNGVLMITYLRTYNLCFQHVQCIMRELGVQFYKVPSLFIQMFRHPFTVSVFE